MRETLRGYYLGQVPLLSGHDFIWKNDEEQPTEMLSIHPLPFGCIAEKEGKVELVHWSWIKDYRYSTLKGNWYLNVWLVNQSMLNSLGKVRIGDIYFKHPELV